MEGEVTLWQEEAVARRDDSINALRGDNAGSEAASGATALSPGTLLHVV